MSFISSLFSAKPQPQPQPQPQSAAARTPQSLVASGPADGPSAPLVLSSSEERVSLLELFTSEGCSSCPPAESWFRQLRERGDLWTRVVPVAFHVDYWNRLGWLDSLSSAASTARQQQYGEEWSSTSIYTPEFVLNGREWRRPSKLADPRRALDTAVAQRVGRLVAERTANRRFTVTFSPANQTNGKLRLTAALLVNGLEHRVTSGENSGKRLVHDFAVLSLVEHRMQQSTSGTYTATVEWPASNPQGAASLSVAFWVSMLDSQLPIQCVGGDLP